MVKPCKAHLESDMYPKTFKDIIQCPVCDLVQVAEIENTFPWGTYIHHCTRCKYIIMESEWNSVLIYKSKNTIMKMTVEQINSTLGSLGFIIQSDAYPSLPPELKEQIGKTISILISQLRSDKEKTEPAYGHDIRISQDFASNKPENVIELKFDLTNYEDAVNKVKELQLLLAKSFPGFYSRAEEQEASITLLKNQLQANEKELDLCRHALKSSEKQNDELKKMIYDKKEWISKMQIAINNCKTFLSDL